MSKAIYTAKPIGSVAALAAALRVSESALVRLSKAVPEYYDWFTVPKKNGDPRQICSPRRELKFLQKRINREVFGHVDFPDYLVGGIPDRDYVKNAERHAHAKALIALDVRDFYPSIKRQHVRNIFKFFCKFPDPVANILTDLTTLDGEVPQGACTSSYIANLVFFDIEPRLVHFFGQRNVRYSRLLDDIAISSASREFTKSEVDMLIDRVTAMLVTRGMHLKNSKTSVTSKSNPEKLMEVTGLWLNRGRPRVRRSERGDIRSAVRRVGESFKFSRYDPDYHEEFNRVSGRVAKVAHLGHFEAPKFRARLRTILPHFDQFERLRIERQVSSLARSDPTKRGTFEYIQRYYTVRYRVNIMRRNDKLKAAMLEKRLKNCAPTRSREDLIYG